MDPAWIALIGTLLGGGIGIKFLDNILSRGQRKIDAATAMREELRKEGESLKREAAELREEIRKIEKELDSWKEKYYILLQELLELRSKVEDDKNEDKW